MLYYLFSLISSSVILENIGKKHNLFHSAFFQAAVVKAVMPL